ncbi:MAG TPA: hypothetical protein VI248_03540, partial [Kineosporiaceae bacterium]
DALLGGAFGSRITSNIREAKGYTYSPYSTIGNHQRATNWAEIADVTTNVTVSPRATVRSAGAGVTLLPSTCTCTTRLVGVAAPVVTRESAAESSGDVLEPAEEVIGPTAAVPAEGREPDGDEQPAVARVPATATTARNRGRCEPMTMPGG